MQAQGVAIQLEVADIPAARAERSAGFFERAQRR